MNWYFDVLKKYAVFTGRSQRAEYWVFFLVNFIILIIFTILQGQRLGPNELMILALVETLYGLAILLPGLAVTVRRLHDTNRSGAWIFIGLIPVIGTIILIVFLAQDSQPGNNQYGPSQKYIPG